MGRDGNGTLGLETRVTVSLLCAVFGAGYWLIMLGARVDAAEQRTMRVEKVHDDSNDEIVKRLDDIAEQQTSMAIDVAAIQARVGVLLEWSDIKRKRTNQRP